MIRNDKKESLCCTRIFLPLLWEMSRKTRRSLAQFSTNLQDVSGSINSVSLEELLGKGSTSGRKMLLLCAAQRVRKPFGVVFPGTGVTPA